MEKNRYIHVFEKYLRQEMSETEKEQLEEMLHHDRELHSTFVRGLKNADPSMDEALSNHLFENIRSSIFSKKKQRFSPTFLKYTVRWAAVILLPVISALLAYFLTINAMEKNASSVTVSADYGEKASITLSDGSRLWLNSGSSISYSEPFNRKARNVNLSGEAYFEVAKDEKHPFTVKTKEMDVQVMGTAFNVSAYDEEQLVSSVILEGQVKVTSSSGQTYILGANQRAIYNKKNHSLSTDRVYASDFVEWKNGNLYFQNRSFDEIANTLSRVFNIDISFVSDELRSIRFSGTLSCSSIRNALDILSLTSPMRYRMNGTTIELYLRE